MITSEYNLAFKLVCRKARFRSLINGASRMEDGRFAHGGCNMEDV